MNILITSAGAKIWLVKAFRDVLPKGWKLHLYDKNPNVATRFLKTNKFYTCMPDIHNYGFVVYSRNGDVLEASAMGHKFAPSAKACHICLDKGEFVKFCDDNGFNTPISFNTDKMFYKPINGSGSQEIGTIDGKNKIFQEYIDWPEYTIDVFIHPDGTPISSVPRERIKVSGGESKISRTVKNDLLIDAGINICKSIGLSWINNVQVFFDGKEIKYIEVNPRCAGASALSIAAGANYPKWIVDIISGKKVKPQIGNFKDGLDMYRYSKDIYR